MARLHFWHRTVGVCSALFVILLVTTGLLLNHSADLGLDRRPVGNELLLDLYHIGSDTQPVSVAVAGHWISKLGRRCYLDGRYLADLEGDLIGAVAAADMLIVASGMKVLLLTREGEVIEALGRADGVPAGMQAIGTDDQGQVLIRTRQGGYRLDTGTLEWQEGPAPDGYWSTLTAAPPGLIKALQRDYRGNGLPLERVLLDIHSGRILGNWGGYLMDAVALVFLLLATTGIWMWVRRRW